MGRVESRASITALIIARDEERNIAPCLRSLDGLADEILVAVDSRTADRTLELAVEAGAKAFPVDWKGYGTTKNEVLERASGDWVLWLDADERMTPELAVEIKKALSGGERVEAFSVPRKAFFLGKWIRHCGWYPGYVTRLFRRGRARFSDKPVHEGLVVEGQTGRLRHPLLHYTDPDLTHYLAKFNSYTDLAAGELFARGRRPGALDPVARPLWFFLRSYLLRLGFLDGTEGLILSVLSGYSVMFKYLKLRELWENAGRAS